jgi:hypothetical protein
VGVSVNAKAVIAYLNAHQNLYLTKFSWQSHGDLAITTSVEEMLIDEE